MAINMSMHSTLFAKSICRQRRHATSEQRGKPTKTRHTTTTTRHTHREKHTRAHTHTHTPAHTQTHTHTHTHTHTRACALTTRTTTHTHTHTSAMRPKSPQLFSKALVALTGKRPLAGQTGSWVSPGSKYITPRS